MSNLERWEIAEAEEILASYGLDMLGDFEDESELHEAHEEVGMRGEDFDAVLSVWREIRAQHWADVRATAIENWRCRRMA